MSLKSKILSIFHIFGHILSEHRTDILKALEPLVIPAAELVFKADIDGDGRPATLDTIEQAALKAGGAFAAEVLEDGELKAELFEQMPASDLKRWLGRALVVEELVAAARPIPALGRIDTALQTAYEWLDDQREQKAATPEK